MACCLVYPDGMDALTPAQRDTVKKSAYAALIDPDGFATQLGRRMDLERHRGRMQGLSAAVLVVLVAGLVAGRLDSMLPLLIALVSVLCLAAGWGLFLRGVKL